MHCPSQVIWPLRLPPDLQYPCFLFKGFPFQLYQQNGALPFYVDFVDNAGFGGWIWGCVLNLPQLPMHHFWDLVGSPLMQSGVLLNERITTYAVHSPLRL